VRLGQFPPLAYFNAARAVPTAGSAASTAEPSWAIWLGRSGLQRGLRGGRDQSDWNIGRCAADGPVAVREPCLQRYASMTPDPARPRGYSQWHQLKAFFLPRFPDGPHLGPGL